MTFVYPQRYWPCAWFSFFWIWLISNCHDLNWALSMLFCPVIWKAECDWLCLINLKELELTSCKKILCPRQIISTCLFVLEAFVVIPKDYIQNTWYCPKYRERTLNLSCIMLKNNPTHLKILRCEHLEISREWVFEELF